MNYSQISIKMGFCFNHLTMMQRQNRSKFDHILSLGHGDFEKGHSCYVDAMVEVKNSVAEIVYELEDSKNVSKFVEYLHNKDKKRFGGKTGMYSFLKRSIFSATEGFMKHETYLKAIGVVNEYKIFNEREQNEGK